MRNQGLGQRGRKRRDAGNSLNWSHFKMMWDHVYAWQMFATVTFSVRHFGRFSEFPLLGLSDWNPLDVVAFLWQYPTLPSPPPLPLVLCQSAQHTLSLGSSWEEVRITPVWSPTLGLMHLIPIVSRQWSYLPDQQWPSHWPSPDPLAFPYRSSAKVLWIPQLQRTHVKKQPKGSYWSPSH